MSLYQIGWVILVVVMGLCALFIAMLFEVAHFLETGLTSWESLVLKIRKWRK